MFHNIILRAKLDTKVTNLPLQLFSIERGGREEEEPSVLSSSWERPSLPQADLEVLPVSFYKRFLRQGVGCICRVLGETFVWTNGVTLWCLINVPHSRLIFFPPPPFC